MTARARLGASARGTPRVPPFGGSGPPASCDHVHIYTLWVSPVNGSNVTGDGTECRPYATIAFAVAQIPPHGNNYGVWANEKWVIGLGPGRYTEPGPIVLRQVRRSIALQAGPGDGAIIENIVRFVQDQQADWPDEPAPGFNPALLPSPWNAITPAPNPLQTWELQGFGGGMQGGRASNNIIFLSRLEFHWASRCDFTSFCMFDRIQVLPGFRVTSASPIFQSVTVEVNDSSFRDGNPGAANEGVFGADNSGAGCTINLKAQDSQIINRIGPFCSLLQIQDCRLGRIARNLDFAGGAAVGNITSPDALNATGLTNCGFEAGASLAVGAPAGASVVAVDGNTLGRIFAMPLSFSGTVRFKVVDVPTRTVRATAVTGLLGLTDQVVLATGGGGPGGIVLTLPPPSAYFRVTMTVKKVDAGAGTVSVAPNGAETIDGVAAPFVITLLNQAVEFYSDGTNWWVT